MWDCNLHVYANYQRPRPRSPWKGLAADHAFATQHTSFEEAIEDCLGCVQACENTYLISTILDGILAQGRLRRSFPAPFSAGNFEQLPCLACSFIALVQAGKSRQEDEPLEEHAWEDRAGP